MSNTIKTRIEFSCVEDDLISSLYEVSKILVALELQSVSLKVFHDKNRNPDLGHSYITVTIKSNPPELAEIHWLKRELFKLRSIEP